jgi:hypothetical protein
MKNLLIGAISGNYTISDIQKWIETSNFENVERILLLYNSNTKLEQYLKQHNIKCIVPQFNFWGQDVNTFETNTGNLNLHNSYDLIHNSRFLHIWCYLQEESKNYSNVIITDVRDVYFNYDPFAKISNKLIATSEMIKYQSEDWNKQHLYENLGLIGLNTMLDCDVYNVGVFGGPASLVKDICADIYLLSVGKPKVADQTSFNYLIQTKYKNTTEFSTLLDNYAVHLHVINAGLVKFDLNDIKKYSIIHQYDRIPGFKK